MVQHHCDLRAIAWAHRITQQFGLSPPVDVKIALAGCGLNIYRVDGLRRNVSFLAYDPQVDTFAVFASPQYDPAHLRVALAHHLGCYILHHHLIQDGREHPCEKNAEPWPDVSVFAGELLLPGDKLRAACKKRQQAFHSGRRRCVSKDIEQTFQVPRTYWRHRLRQLGYRNCTEFLGSIV